VIRQYGDSAEWEAAQRADREIKNGDPREERVWVGITKSINALPTRKPDGPLNQFGYFNRLFVRKEHMVQDIGRVRVLTGLLFSQRDP
jgi:hypothetical protein